MHGRILGLILLLFSTPLLVASPLDETVVRLPLAEGVSPDDAVESLKLRANILNMQLVGELPLYEQLRAMGVDSRRIEIFELCNPLTAHRMVEHDPAFAAYLPCRITLLEDAEGRHWLIMMDLDPLIEGTDMPEELRQEAITVRDQLLEIMEAAAKGEF